MCNINMDPLIFGKILLLCCLLTPGSSAFAEGHAPQGGKFKAVSKRYVDLSRHAWECHPGCKMYCLPSCKLSCCTPGAPQYTPDIFPKLIQYQASIPKPKTVPRACPAPCPTTCYPQCDQGCCSRSQPPAPFSEAVLPPPADPVTPTRKNVCAVGCSPLCAPSCNPSCCYMRALIARRKQAAAKHVPKPKPHPRPTIKKTSSKPNDGTVCSAECKTICKPSCKFECCSADYKPPPPPPPRRTPHLPARRPPPAHAYVAPRMPNRYVAPPSPMSLSQYYAPSPSPSPYVAAPMPANPYYQYAEPQPFLAPPPQPPQCASPCSHKCAPFCTPQCCLENAIHLKHYIVAPYTTNIPEIFHNTPKPHVIRGPPKTSKFVYPVSHVRPEAPKIACHGYCRDSCSSICPSFCCDRSASVNWDKRTSIHKSD